MVDRVTELADNQTETADVIGIDRNKYYPAKEERLNTELCPVLSYLDSPSVVGKTMALMKKTQTKALAYDKEMLTRHEYGKEILKTMANTPNSP